MKITDTEFVAFDLETTGKEPDSDWICELGVAIFENGALVSRGNAGFKPPKPIEDEARDVHGISNEMVENKPDFGTFIPRLVSKFDLVPMIVGYNCRRFDAPILDRECERAGSEWRVPRAKMLDLMSFVNWYHRGERERKQGVIAETIYEVTAKGDLHSAAVDTQLTGELLLAMVESGIIPDDVEEALSEELRLGAMIEEEFKRWTYWLYRDRQTKRLRMGAGKHCGRYLHSVEKRTLSWYVNNISDLPGTVKKAFEDARDGKFQDEMQDSMIKDENTTPVEVVWGGWK